MPPSDSDEGSGSRPSSCPSCGTPVSPYTSSCRNCSTSLEDADALQEGAVSGTPVEDIDIGDHGCPKCNGQEAEIDDIATTGTGLSKLFNIQTRRFKVVTCTNCGYSELYRGQDAEVMIDLFIG